MAPVRSALFRALVVNTQDPEGRSRVQLQIPQLMGGARSGWALPVPAVGAVVPEVGAQVIAAFEGSDLSRPVYFAQTGSGGDDGALDHALLAEEMAQHAQESADGAQATANSALGVAQTAQGDATKALQGASTAQAAAEQAKVSASTAQTTANQALDDASTAQARADEAYALAQSADTLADGEVTTPKLADGAVTGAKLSSTALNGKTADGMSLTNTTVNGQRLDDTGWLSFAEAGVTLVSGFSPFSTSCRVRVRNGVAYIVGTVQITATTGTATTLKFADINPSSTLGQLLAPVGTAVYTPAGSFAHSSAASGGSGVISMQSTSLNLGYRTVLGMPTGYFQFSAAIPC